MINSLDQDQLNQSTTFLLRSIWLHLSRRRQIQLCCLLVVMLLSGVAELVSLGAVLPFLALLGDSERLSNYPFIQQLQIRFGISEPKELLLATTLLFAMAVMLAGLIRLWNLWLNGRLAAAVGSDLSCEAYRRTLFQPYEVHLKLNSSAIITGATTYISQTISALNSLLRLITSSIVAVCLFLGLLFIDTTIALSATLVFGAAYLVLAIISRRELVANGQKIATASTEQIKSLQEGLGAIRDVLLDGSQSTYLEIYKQADRPVRRLQAKNDYIGTFPRYALESLGMVAIAFLGGLIAWQRGNGASVIPLPGAFALGAQRLLPALQQIYGGWAALNAYKISMSNLVAMLNQHVPVTIDYVKPSPLTRSIFFEDVRFHYNAAQSDVLVGTNFEIQHGERIGIFGPSGAGKSTVVDLIMGLLKPSEGRVLVDGKDLHDPRHPERLIAWRSTIAHVPQAIYLSDSSIAENIAFGTPRSQIDHERVQKAAQQSQISAFIESIPRGYDTFVGERGVRLSGGQRQRIGIARALYKQASLIVLDEATSALDMATEQEVMRILDGLSQDLTIVMIAHRLSTLSQCDRVFELTPRAPIRITTPSELFSESN